MKMKDGKMKEGAKNGSLIGHVADLRSFSSGLLALAEVTPERVSAPQLLFFLFAGLADLAGKPATFTEIKEMVGGPISRSLHTTYKVFLSDNDREPGRQVALGWLMRETDRSDNRRKYLRLTKEGREVMTEVVRAITGEDI
ncbi:MAG: hypothetical protein C0511_09245 [Hyphomicrobium sp.]|nr:hypothetical protein [Hyphomicrobium sp.]